MAVKKSRGVGGRRSRSGKGRLGKKDALSAGTEGIRSWEVVRQDKVLRAKQLLQDACYPSDEVVESVARLLTRHWRRLGRMTAQSPPP